MVSLRVWQRRHFVSWSMTACARASGPGESCASAGRAAASTARARVRTARRSGHRTLLASGAQLLRDDGHARALQDLVRSLASDPDHDIVRRDTPDGVSDREVRAIRMDRADLGPEEDLDLARPRRLLELLPVALLHPVERLA